MKLGEQKPEQKVFGFIHVATFGHWREIVKQQLRKIQSSGLYSRTSKIYICKLGQEEYKTNDPKVEVISNQDIQLAEAFTLSILQKQCRKHPDCLVWYIHTKGVSHQNNPDILKAIFHWRYAMEYFLLSYYDQCIEALETHDACGLFWYPHGTFFIGPHFSGNFWWSTSFYINTLEEIHSWAKQNYAPKPMRSRYEFWIGSNPAANMKCLHTEPYEINGPWLYDYALPFENYAKCFL